MSDTAAYQEVSEDLFCATAFWVLDEVGGHTLYKAFTCYDWSLVQTIQDWPTPSPYQESVTPAGPKCLLLYADTEVKLLVPMNQVMTGWQEYIKRERAASINPLARNISAN